MAKDAVFTMKLEPELREAFLEAAREAHRPASQIVRDLMRGYVERQQEAKDYDAFVARKVAIARTQAEAGEVVSNDEVKALFARRRAELAKGG
ncbi:antitoxin of toxin-antitoxin stability system [Glycocaulis profundi]|nr:antitoxin of toxin-antitoxin stability system [Glycocaulis profundi]